MALQDQIPLLHLFKGVVANNIDTKFKPAMIHCKTFQDNSGALEWPNYPKSKHLNNTYHHFGHYLNLQYCQGV